MKEVSASIAEYIHRIESPGILPVRRPQRVQNPRVLPVGYPRYRRFVLPPESFPPESFLLSLFNWVL